MSAFHGKTYLSTLMIEFSCNLCILVAAQIPAMKADLAVEELCTLEIGVSAFIFHTPGTCQGILEENIWEILRHPS
jgi:hypothetical protein